MAPAVSSSPLISAHEKHVFGIGGTTGTASRHFPPLFLFCVLRILCFESTNYSSKRENWFWQPIPPECLLLEEAEGTEQL